MTVAASYSRLLFPQFPLIGTFAFGLRQNSRQGWEDELSSNRNSRQEQPKNREEMGILHDRPPYA